MVSFAVRLVIDLQELERLDHHRVRTPDLAGDVEDRHRLVGAVERGRPGIDHRLDALEALEEIDVPPITPKLAVGDRGQAHRLLLRYRVADAAVLDVAQRLAADLARLRGGTGPLQARAGAAGCRPGRPGMGGSIWVAWLSSPGARTEV